MKSKIRSYELLNDQKLKSVFLANCRKDLDRKYDNYLS